MIFDHRRPSAPLAEVVPTRLFCIKALYGIPCDIYTACQYPSLNQMTGDCGIYKVAAHWQCPQTCSVSRPEICAWMT